MHTGYVDRFMATPSSSHDDPTGRWARPHVSNRPSPDLFAGVKQTLRTEVCDVTVLPGPGRKAWETALAMTLKPGDKVVVVGRCDATADWMEAATRTGLDVELVGADPTGNPAHQALSKRLGKDCKDEVKAAFVVQNGTANVAAVRRVLDENFHDALLFVHTASALDARDFEMDAWEVDVAVATHPGSLMSPMGLTVLAVSPKARPVLQFAAE